MSKEEKKKIRWEVISKIVRHPKPGESVEMYVIRYYPPDKPSRVVFVDVDKFSDIAVMEAIKADMQKLKERKTGEIEL